MKEEGDFLRQGRSDCLQQQRRLGDLEIPIVSAQMSFSEVSEDPSFSINALTLAQETFKGCILTRLVILQLSNSMLSLILIHVCSAAIGN